MVVDFLEPGSLGKGSVHIEPLCAAVARLAGGRPVKIVQDRHEEFLTVVKHAATLTLKTGVRRDGTLTARQATLYWNGGAYAETSTQLVQAALVRAVGPYRIPAVHVDCYGVHTNRPPSGSYRGAMTSQTAWAYESQMDMIARRLGRDPLQLRMKNLLRSGEHFVTGEVLPDVHFVECLQAAADGLGKPSRHRDRGRGYAVMMKNPIGTSKSQARLKLLADGTLLLYTSTVEMGQGSHTVLAQIAADTLGLLPGSVQVLGPDTSITPYDATTVASRSTEMMGTAVRMAAEELKQKLPGLAARMSGSPPPGDVLRHLGLRELEAQGEHETHARLDPETGQGVATPHWHQGAGAAEVQVDRETGQVTVLRYHGASYAGQVVNRRLLELQNDGNVIYGMGAALMEEMTYEHRQLVNGSLYDFRDYRVPSLRDMPVELSSTSLEIPDHPPSGIGEMTLPPVAPAIANAIEDAVGVRITDLPITADKVLRALQEKAR